MSCGRDTSGPESGRLVARGFGFLTRFASNGIANGVATDLVPFAKVRIVLRTAGGTVAVDQVVDFPSGAGGSGGCTNLGGALGGSGTFAPCP